MSVYAELVAMTTEIQAGVAPEPDRLDAIHARINRLRPVEVEPVRDALQTLLKAASAELNALEGQLDKVVKGRRGVRGYGALRSGGKISQRVLRRA